MRTKTSDFSIERYESASNVVLIVRGPVDAEASAKLGPACASILESHHNVTIDLANVGSADGVGLRLLITLWHLGVTLVNVPTSISKKIEVVRELQP